MENKPYINHLGRRPINNTDYKFSGEMKPVNFSPFLSVLLLNTINDGFTAKTKLNLLSDLYPFVSSSDQKQIENILSFSNSIYGNQPLPTYSLKRNLTEEQKLSSLFSVLDKYGTNRSRYITRMAESLFETKRILNGNSSTATILSELIKNSGLAGSNTFNLLNGLTNFDLSSLANFSGMDLSGILNLFNGK